MNTCAFDLAQHVPEVRNALEALVEVPSNVAVPPAKRPAACLGVVHTLRKLVLGVPSAIPTVRAAFDELARVALDGIDVGQLGPNGRRDVVAELVQRAPDPCGFKFGNWQTLGLENLAHAVRL